jgi:hypothetical protein
VDAIMEALTRGHRRTSRHPHRPESGQLADYGTTRDHRHLHDRDHRIKSTERDMNVPNLSAVGLTVRVYLDRFGPTQPT